MIRMLHVAARDFAPEIWVEDFVAALRRLGELTLIRDAKDWPEDRLADAIRRCDVLLTSWGSAAVPASVADDPGDLKYICNVTGTLRACVPLRIVEAGIPVTNWGDIPAGPIAEGAVTLLLACLKSLPRRIREIREEGWRPADPFRCGLLEGLNLGLYGCGAIGQRFAQMCLPFGPVMRAYDPFVADLPTGVARVDSLEALFDASEAIAIHAGLTEQTRGSVTAELLSRLPDGGMLVNTARGGIVDQEALFAELAGGRLRAALDTIEPDEPPPPEHACRQWDHLILTAHDIGLTRPIAGMMGKIHDLTLENLGRFDAGRPLRFVMDAARYRLST